MLRALALCLTLWALPARAEWTRTDTSLQVAYTVLHLADWSQTITIARTGTEGNRILGRQPSRYAVHGYFAATLLAHAGIAYLLPKPYRSLWQVVTIGVEFGTVASNRTFGVRFGLP